MKEKILGKEYNVKEMPDGNVWMMEDLDYKEESMYHSKYGCYYNWKTACKIGKEAKGWHLPTDDEFLKLYNSFKKDVDFKKNWNAGYSGYCVASGVLGNQGTNGYYWSSSQASTTHAYYVYINTGYVYPQFSYYKFYGFSVRLIKDKQVKKELKDLEVGDFIKNDKYTRKILGKGTDKNGLFFVLSFDNFYGVDTIFHIKDLKRLNYSLTEPLKNEILDDKEKEYLSAVIKPFKKKEIEMYKDYFEEYYNINIEIKGEDSFTLPYFSKDSNMYVGMEVGKKYSLKDLGL